MRIARKLTLLAAMALAATALMATTANAQSPVTIVEEDGGAHCVPSCPLHATGESHLFGHLFGFEQEVADCITEFEGHVGENGEGAVESVLLTNHTGSTECVVEPCNLPWPVHVREPRPGVEHLIAEFCVEEIDTGTHRSCLIEIPVSETPAGSHDYESDFRQDNQTTGLENHGNASNCELIGEFHLEQDSATHPEIEIVH